MTNNGNDNDNDESSNDPNPAYGSIIMPSIKKIQQVVSEEWLLTDAQTESQTHGRTRQISIPPPVKPVGDKNTNREISYYKCY